MKMAAEKHRSKNGGYVGGLLQLFDWNTKSRKKLFSTKSSPEESKQKKRCDRNVPITNMMDEDDFMAGSSVRGGSEYSCASSMTDDDFGGAKAPSVVARLMGLDTMPTSNFPEPYATPYYGSAQSFQGVDSRSNGSSRSVLEPRHAKAMARPIEKFQTEMLPPKSAKSIPLSHHKLLSPIKRANYIPSENAAHIMEAAARIIGPGPTPPQTANARVKLSTAGSSSVPLIVRDLKEKVEASQKSLKGKSQPKSRTSSVDTVSSRVSSDSEECSASVKSRSNKSTGKSISLALQAKANVQKRGGLNSRNSEVRKESSEVTSNETFRSQASTHSSTQRKSLPPGVLRQNNQKQNCLVEKGKPPSKPSNARKTSNVDSSLSRSNSLSKNTANSKVASKRSKPEVTAGKREEGSSNVNITSKRRSIDGNFQSEKNQTKTERLNTSSGLLMDRQSRIFEPSKRKGTDVISFTFTAPMKRSFGHSSDTFREESEKNDLFSADFRGKRSLLNSGATNSTKFTLSGNDVIGGDALNALLERKLQELTRGMESPSPPKAGTSEGSSSMFQDSSNKSSTPDYMIEDQNDADDIIKKYNSPGFSSADVQGFMMKHKLQVTTDQGMDNLGRNHIDMKKLLDYRLPSPVSVLEQLSFGESCNSSDTFDSFYTGGSKQSSSVQAREVLGTSCLKPQPMEVETDLLDCASSVSYMKNGVFSANWELEYIMDILHNVELMFEDFAIGRTHKVINPLLFEHLESRKWGLNRHEPKLSRKAIFDCVAECMDIRFKQYASGGSKTWIKGLFAVTSKRKLAEEVHKEISGLKNLGDSMVDELVDKDMSSKNGAWLDFEREAFELGAQIENRILNHLLDEVIADLLVL